MGLLTEKGNLINEEIPQHTIMLFVCHPKILHKHCFQFLLGVKMAPRDTENNAYVKFWGDKQRALWHAVVFLEWSIVSYTSDSGFTLFVGIRTFGLTVFKGLIFAT